MQQKKSLLPKIFGTKTKTHIIEHFIHEPEPVTKHALCKIIYSGIGPTYKQIDQLIAMGVLKEFKNRITLDTSFPFYDDIANLVLTMTNYTNDHRILLDRINSLLRNDYYITGYIAACQNGPPIDHEQRTILVAVFKKSARIENYLKTLAEITPIRLSWFFIEKIPKDVKRQKIFNSKVWLASIERGIVDCIEQHDCDIYPIILLILQNIIENTLDKKKLIEIAQKKDAYEFVLTVIFEINMIMKKPIVKLNVSEQAIASANRKPEISETVKKAYNTVMGG
jgi:hypothetical protein